MPRSVKEHLRYLESQVGPDAQVRQTMNGAWEIRCRHCGDPDHDGGGTPPKVRMRSQSKAEVIALWWAHEATGRHEVERDRR
jgi:hypothetical protein